MLRRPDVMRWLIRHLDRHLRRSLGIVEFTDDPACIFRIRSTAAERPLRTPEGERPAGTRIVELHFWNEHMPAIPRDGATMSWGIRGQRMLARSCRLLANHLRDTPELRGAEAIGGNTVLFVAADGSGKGIFPRLGFQVARHPHRLGRFGEFFENVHAWLIMWAYNTATLRDRHLLRLERWAFWMSTDDFVRRYAK